MRVSSRGGPLRKMAAARGRERPVPRRDGLWQLSCCLILDRQPSGKLHVGQVSGNGDEFRELL